MLKNKLGITNPALLDSVEEKISKIKAVQLFEQGYLDTLKPGTFNTLAFIHKYLFADIYEFTGQIRDVNLAKGNFRFASAMYLPEALKKIEAMIPDNMKSQLQTNSSDKDSIMHFKFYFSEYEKLIEECENYCTEKFKLKIMH